MQPRPNVHPKRREIDPGVLNDLWLDQSRAAAPPVTLARESAGRSSRGIRRRVEIRGYV